MKNNRLLELKKKYGKNLSEYKLVSKKANTLTYEDCIKIENLIEGSKVVGIKLGKFTSIVYMIKTEERGKNDQVYILS